MKSFLIRFAGIALAAANIALGCQLVFGANGILELKRQRAGYFEMLEQDRILKETGRKMSSEIRLLGRDPAFLEQTIRRELNFLKENEVLYLFSGRGENPGTGT